MTSTAREHRLNQLIRSARDTLLVSKRFETVFSLAWWSCFGLGTKCLGLSPEGYCPGLALSIGPIADETTEQRRPRRLIQYCYCCE